MKRRGIQDAGGRGSPDFIRATRRSFITVMPALRLRSGQAPAGIQGEQAAASGYSAWIPTFAGMTQPSSTPQNHHDKLPWEAPRAQAALKVTIGEPAGVGKVKEGSEVACREQHAVGPPAPLP